MTAAVVSRLCRRWRSRVPTKKHSKCLQARTSGGIAASVQCDGSLIVSHPQAVAEQMRQKARDAVELVMPGCYIQRRDQQGVQLVSQRHACQHQHIGRISSCCAVSSPMTTSRRARYGVPWQLHSCKASGEPKAAVPSPCEPYANLSVEHCSLLFLCRSTAATSCSCWRCCPAAASLPRWRRCPAAASLPSWRRCPAAASLPSWRRCPAAASLPRNLAAMHAA